MPVAVGNSYSVASGLTIHAGRTNLIAGAAAPTLNEHLDFKVFQRVGTSKNVPVTGAYSGTPSLVQARAADADSGSPITAWTTVATNPTGGTYSGVLGVPEGMWYKLQVRDGVNTALVTAGANKFGVGVCIVEIGQSNMANFGTTSSTGYKYPLGDPNVVEFYTGNNTFRRISRINDTFAPNTLYGGVGGWTTAGTSGVSADGYVYVGNLVSEGLNLPVAVLNKAVSGSSIASWTTTPTYWNAFVTSLNLMGGDFEIALWFQGEYEANAGVSAASYKGSLGVLHQQMKTQTGRGTTDLHFCIIGLGPQGIASSFSGGSDLKIGPIRAAQTEYCNETAGAHYVTSAMDTRTASDQVHILGDTDGDNKLGRRYAKTILSALGVGLPASGPRAASAAHTGGYIDLTLAHTGGTALMDGIGGSGSGLTGFRVFDDGAAGALLGYTTSITSSTNVRLTLGGTPVGPFRVDYGMTNSPHSSDTTVSDTVPVYSTILCDNAFYHNGANASPFGLSTTGSPLQPFSAMTVTG